jgi:hypothetical protein
MIYAPATKNELGFEMSEDDGADAWTKFADIESNARLANEVALFLMKQSACSRSKLPQRSHSASSAEITASNHASKEESGGAPASGDGAECTGAGGIGEDTGLEFESCGPGGISRDAIDSCLLSSPPLRASEPPQELDSDGVRAGVAEGSISAMGGDVTGTPSETELVAVTAVGAGAGASTVTAFTPEWLPGGTELMFMRASADKRARLARSGSASRGWRAGLSC